MKDKLKVALFFLLGLLLSWVGLVIGLIFGLRTKEQKWLKLILLTAGFLLSTFVFPRFLYPLLSNKSETFLYDKIPELNTVNQALKTKYPTRVFSLEISWDQTSFVVGQGAGTTVKTETISITFEADKSASQEVGTQDSGSIAQTACQALKDENVIVKVQANKTITFFGIIPFNTYYSVEGTCKEWISNAGSESPHKSPLKK